MKILLVTFLLAACFQGTFKLKYTGHSRGWSDNLTQGSYDWPVKFLWVESIDSSWAEMQIPRKDHPSDTITFSHLSNGRWRLIRYKNEKDTLADVDIEQSKDSLHIALGFGFSGVSYYARKD